MMLAGRSLVRPDEVKTSAIACRADDDMVRLHSACALLVRNLAL